MSPAPVASSPASEIPPRAFLSRFYVGSIFGLAVLYYYFTALLSMICLVLVLQPRNFNPLYAYEYSGDSLLHTMAIKAIVEHGWYQHIDRLGAPDGLQLEDFPMCDNLCCAIIRFLSLWTSNPFLIQNILFIGLFPVTAVVACWTLRRFELSAGAALLGGMLYALLPYHFLRGTWHLFLTAYFLVPPACLVAWWAMRGVLLAPPDVREQRAERRVRRWRLAGGVVVCALIGCNAVYYPFFACVMLGVAGLYALITRRDWRHFVLAGALAGLVGTMVIVNLLPTLLYVHQHGKTEAGVRLPGEAEHLGLKIAQLLLPITNHRLKALATIKAFYNDTAPLVNENDLVSLGMIGSFGLLLLFVWVAFVRRRTDPPTSRPGEAVSLGEILGPISVLNLVAILLGTIGGFSSLFALLVSPQIRSYNRISVFIAFFALLASVAALDHLVWRRLRSPAARAAFFVGTLALIAFGVWDETAPGFAPDYSRQRHREIDDAQYFAQIENMLPPGSMVFQLPATTFPEAETLNQMGDYSHLRGYIQTKTLRWSYGGIRGRRNDVWYQETAALPPDSLLKTVVAAGFRGLYLDGNGYADDGASEFAQFSQALGGDAPLLSKDGRTAFFDLIPHVDAVLAGLSAARRAALTDVLHVEWKGGFFGREHNGSEDWRWCGPHGDLVLDNDSSATHKSVRVVMDCRTALAGTFDLHVSGDLIHENLKISDRDGQISKVIDLSPGQHVIHFDCDAPPKEFPGELRMIVWQAHDMAIKDVTAE